MPGETDPVAKSECGPNLFGQGIQSLLDRRFSVSRSEVKSEAVPRKARKHVQVNMQHFLPGGFSIL